MLRVALLMNIPAPYRLPMFRELSRHFDLKVIFDAPKEQNREWKVPADLGFAHSYCKGITLPYLRRRADFHAYDTRYLHLHCELPSLSRFHPDLIISCELGPRSLQALTYSSLRKIPLILWSEGTPHTEGWVAGWKRSVRRHLVTHAARFWTNGQESADLLRTYGALPSQIDCGVIGVDTYRFLAGIEERRNARDSLRESLGLKGAVLLFVGQFIQRKGIHEYLRALERLGGSTRSEFSAVLIGGGPLHGVMKDWGRAHPEIKLKLIPFQEPERLADYYAAADVFVLPTLEDNWSLVTLEAALAGLPQIFSKFNGAGADLMGMGLPGECVDPTDTDQFVSSLQRFVDQAFPRASSQVVAQIASAFSPEECAGRARRSIENCLEYAIAA